MKNHLFYVDAIVTTPVKLHIRAVDEQEAFARAMDGVWHGCYPEPISWDKAKITHVGPITKGPGVN